MTRIDDHLFRRESGRIVSALVRIFGAHNLGLAEDVAQEAFCKALEVWSFRGVPENPSAWLMATAKNRALDVLRRRRTANTFAPELGRLLESEWTLVPTVEDVFSSNSVRDEQLRMMFACCHPKLAEEAQVMLILNILCGFHVDEVAAAFVTSHPAAEKRISRAKKVFTSKRELFDLGDAKDVARRLPALQRALYLLFNEGYHGASAEFAIRSELCREAMRLTAILLSQLHGATPDTYALAALMCFNCARLPGRTDDAGRLCSLFDQDRSRWDRDLIAEGFKFIEMSAIGSSLSQYHLEAAMASVHARASDTNETDWSVIVSLYDALLALQPSPVVALNRAIAIGQRDGPEIGLAAIAGIEHRDRLRSYPFYFAALGEFERRAGRSEKAAVHLEAALAVARNPMEVVFLEERLAAVRRTS